ncbi:MAG: hypothetical protein ACKVWR_00785 [Acidimicrobiales bacterium]
MAGRAHSAATTVLAAALAACSSCSSGAGSAPAPAAAGAPPAPTVAAAAPRPGEVCAEYNEGRAAGQVDAPDLMEASGLAAGGADPGVLWTHNDGDDARLFALSPTGAQLAVIPIPGVGLTDWEDLALGPGPTPGPRWLYLADIGDNRARRDTVKVVRVPEPVLGDAAAGPAQSFTLRYPDGAHDAESLLMDPVTGEAAVIVKDLAAPTSAVYRLPSLVTAAPGAAALTLERAGEIDLAGFEARFGRKGQSLLSGLVQLPTAAAVSADGSRFAVRTYGSIWLWARPRGASLVDTLLTGAPCEAPAASESQGEALAFLPGGGYATLSEGPRPALYTFSSR